MPNPTPPSTLHASQHNSGLPTIVRKYEDMSDDQQKLCDDLISRLADLNLTNEIANTDNRKEFWKLVFAGGWNSTSIIRSQPKKPRERTVDEVQFETGEIIGSPPSSSTNPARANGQPAFLKPNVE
ncbi:hypothetical protein B0T25DRAFT_570156 [Lasiosphaeria hispida]|uniref:Uncharacterized protein n=1 Tax=Lasiosphaeria hispida TaxID=260671 RepID=A0AAJ0HFA2_9PEZI|nr:hypothetical protein B0T25DRAFT_570156 [Lasiosphaeria hispida]